MLKLKFVILLFTLTCSLFANVNNFEQETKKKYKTTFRNKLWSFTNK